GEVSEAKAWQQLTLNANPSGMSSMSVFLHGRCWDVVADGQGFANHAGLNLNSNSAPGARLLNLWL
ncbi:MAG: carbon-nitrogen hydrolase family protein, partial [Pseudomonas sp.]